MKIFKISQTIEYLQDIGVDKRSAQFVLDYLLSLELDERKIAVRRIRQNPAISIDELKQPIKQMNKVEHLKQQNIASDIIEYANELSPKYSVWIAREINRWMKSIIRWHKQYQWLKNQPKTDEITSELNKMYMQQDPMTGVDYVNLNKNLQAGDKDLFKMIFLGGYKDDLVDWIDQNEPDLMKMSIKEAYDESEKWHKEMAQKEIDESIIYKTHNVVYTFEDGWQIVKLSAKDCNAEGERMGHCFAKGTLVRTWDGYLPIETISIGDNILCEDGTFRKVVNTFSRDYNGKMIQFSTRFGADKITVTPEHQFKCLTQNEFHAVTPPCRLHTCGRNIKTEKIHNIEWQEIQLIGEDGYILSTIPIQTKDLQTIHIPSEFIKSKTNGSESFAINKDFLWIIGMYIAEGSSDGDKLQFALASYETEYADRIVRFFESNGYHTWVRKEKDDYNGLVVKISSRKLSRWLTEWLGQGCENKYIPSELLNLPNEKIAFLLGGVLDGDNCKNSNSFHQTSKLLALQVTEIGLRIGIHQPTISINNNTRKNRKQSYTVEHADPSIKREANSRKRGIWKHKNNILISPYKFEEIDYCGKVYNIEVDTVKSYVVQNLLAHNCVGGEGYKNSITSGAIEIYSLRDQKNDPHATIEMVILQRTDAIRKVPIRIEQIQGKGNEEPIDEYKARIKEWFNTLKSKGIEFEPIDLDETENIDVDNFTDYENAEDDYGIPQETSAIGPDDDDYFKNLFTAYQRGDVRGHGDFYEGPVIEIIDNLISFAIKKGHLESFNKAVDKFVEWADDELMSNSGYDDSLPPFPQEEDFITYPDEIDEQPEFQEEGFAEVKEEIFRKEEYDEAISNYDSLASDLAQEFPPTRISSYLVKEWNQAMEAAKKTQEAQPIAASSKRVVKTAVKKIPSAEELAAYVEALNIHLENNKIKDPQIEKLVKRLPYPDSIRIGFSEEECRLVFESIAHAWRKITKQDLVEETKIEHPPKGLEGNYWMVTGGVLLEGPNHFTIIKQNINLFSTLLNISAFVLHEKIASPPDELIKTVLDHGGMRVFINKDKRGYFQLADDTYSKWGRKKVKGLDLKNKIVKVIDRKTPYSGWKSGILVKL